MSCLIFYAHFAAPLFLRTITVLSKLMACFSCCYFAIAVVVVVNVLTNFKSSHSAFCVHKVLHHHHNPFALLYHYYHHQKRLERLVLLTMLKVLPQK